MPSSHVSSCPSASHPDFEQVFSDNNNNNIENDLDIDNGEQVTNLEDDSYKSMIRYHLNWAGLPLALAAVGYYGHLIYKQINGGFPQDIKTVLNLDGMVSLRYVGAFFYFLAALLNPRFIFEHRNAESPLLLASIMQFAYEFMKTPTDFLALLLPIAVLALAFLRRRPYFRVFLNAWTKDKSELRNLIRQARKAAVDL